ncbi:AAA family ATPase [Tundrisphaera sp. TA3]|uniref:bifunctional aminoglycoside phosphotransferase/ATP-binding protein n=1 Tax=Tundrisphaera sp. TA3 TaxID=3435775 RepID=UPI003EB91611
MELDDLIAALSDPAAYPDPVDAVEVHQTHISVVFLAGPHAYKIKKPLDLGFLDYSTLEKRRFFCEREVALNRRLAPSVYLGVLPVVRRGAKLAFGGPGDAVEWAVEMIRLSEGDTLRERVRRDEIGPPQVEDLAARVAAFHADAASGPDISAGGRFDVVAGNARENFEQAARHAGVTVARPVFERVRALTEEALARLRPVIESRAARDVPRDTHGDLRLGHVYLYPGRRPPDDLAIVDCIEFSDRYRHADPVADMAFLVMDFARAGRGDLGAAFAGAYFRASGDAEGRALLPFYSAYRAVVKAKVEGLKHEEGEIPAADRALALEKARACWLLALGELEAPGRRPGLVLVGGLPGTGKSTLARALADRSGFAVIRSDVVRKELAGLAGGDSARAGYGEGIYGREWGERTYAECSRRAGALLLEGERVVVDASFGREEDRRRFLDLATSLGVPAVFLLCRADPDVARERIRGRRGDASDADWSIHLAAASHWEEVGSATRRATREIDAGGTREAAISVALDALREFGIED